MPGRREAHGTRNGSGSGSAADSSQQPVAVAFDFEREKAETIRLLQIFNQLKIKLHSDMARRAANSFSSLGVMYYIYTQTNFLEEYSAEHKKELNHEQEIDPWDLVWPAIYGIAAKAVVMGVAQLSWPYIERAFSKSLDPRLIAEIPRELAAESEVNAGLATVKNIAEERIAELKKPLYGSADYKIDIVFCGIALKAGLGRLSLMSASEDKDIYYAMHFFVASSALYNLLMRYVLQCDADKEIAEISNKMKHDGESAKTKLNQGLHSLLPGKAQRQLIAEWVAIAGGNNIGYLKMSFQGHARNKKASDSVALELFTEAIKQYLPQDANMIYIENQSVYVMLDCFLQRDIFKQRLDAAFDHLKDNVFNSNWQYAASHYNFLKSQNTTYGLHFLERACLEHREDHFVICLSVSESIARRALLTTFEKIYGVGNVVGRYPQVEIHVRNHIRQNLSADNIFALQSSIQNAYKATESTDDVAGVTALPDSDDEVEAVDTAKQTDENSSGYSKAMLRFLNRWNPLAPTEHTYPAQALTWADKNARNENELVSVKVPGAPANIFYVEWGLEETNFREAKDNKIWRDSLPVATLRPLTYQGSCFGYKIRGKSKDDRIVLLPIARGEGEHNRKILFRAVAVLDHKDIDVLTANGKFGGNANGNAISAEQLQAGKQILDNDISHVAEYEAETFGKKQSR
jgi:hypothetical protein